jgi:NADH-quinone oxidoreductase subunit H
MKTVFDYLIFPGFLFSVCAGLLAGVLERKITARLQWRVGPPWLQNFTDIIKLFGKETIFPHTAQLTFFMAPLLSLASAALVAAILGKGVIVPLESFIGDLIVVLYLLVIPAVALIMGASASRNPLASVGASREMKLCLSYELPFLLSVITVIIRNAGALQIGQIINHQINFGSTINSLSGVLAFIVMLLCVQAKLGLVPFDASEAEQEIMGGVLIEYSGVLLALFKLAKAIVLYALILLVIVLFMGKDLSWLFMSLKFTGVLLVIVLLKNTNPRLRIDQSLRFFWRVPTALGAAAVVLALMGR